jgi:predicted esterase YcpF (UPF0227 family)
MVMEKIVIYCHGYNSAPNSSKTERLSAEFETHAWHIDVDPSVSILFLEKMIDNLLLDHINEDIQLVFVGTSLGAWYAARLAESYGAKSVLINPSIDPQTSLQKYVLGIDIRMKYDTKINFNKNTKVFIGTNDEVLSFDGVDFGDADVEYVKADHRFAGEEFNKVIEYIKGM